MWRAHPVGWLARSYRVTESYRPIGTVEFGSWSESGALVLDGRRLTIRREGFWNPKFHLVEEQATLATVRSAGAFQRGFYLMWGGEGYRLAPTSMFSRTFVLTRRGDSHGQIRALGLFSRGVEIELDDELPRELRLFATWIVLLAGRRAAAVVAAT